jgi:hypothetical protein
MNLFNNPTLSELSQLISLNSNYYSSYDLIVDHDGEVILEPSSAKSPEQLKKYKFYIRGLQGKANIGIIAARNLRFLNQLYKNLLFCWENEVDGKIDFDMVSNIQTINLWLEINKISHSSALLAAH